MRWGKGGMVGVRKAIWEHEQALKKAALILQTECGIKHERGTRDLCPSCAERRAYLAMAGGKP